MALPVLKEFSDKENARTYTLPGHSVAAPRLVIQKRRVAATPTSQGESKVDVVYGANDVAGLPLPSKVVASVSVRYPANALSADVTSVITTLRDIVNSDEFTGMVNSQNYLA